MCSLCVSEMGELHDEWLRKPVRATPIADKEVVMPLSDAWLDAVTMWANHARLPGASTPAAASLRP